MDLLRRLSSGELSELFGEVAFKKDVQNRVHRFRHRQNKRLPRWTLSNKILSSPIHKVLMMD